MIEFSERLEERIREVVDAVAGSSTPAPYIKSYGDHAADVPYDQMPHMMVIVRTDEKESSGEIGNEGYDLWRWTVHLYYLDIETSDDPNAYKTAKQRRSNIMSRVTKGLERNKRLNNLEVIDSDGAREYVYDSEISAVLFDSSGQPGDYSFVTELYLNVFTAKT